MRIKELVEKSGVPRTTIHYYLRQGKLHPPVKTGRTMAYYDESHLQRLREISNLKKKLLDTLSPAKQAGPDFSKTVTTTREKDRKRQEIIKEAIRVFSRKGYHQTKVADITQSLKISTGTFYIYFRNKRDLFIDVVDDIFRNIVGEATEAIKEESDYLERMRIRGRVFYENYTKYNEILNQLRAEMAGDDQWPVEKIKKIYHGLTKPVISEIEAAIREGVCRDIDPDLLAYALTGLIEIMSLRLSLDRKYRLENVIIFIEDLLSSRLIPA